MENLLTAALLRKSAAAEDNLILIRTSPLL
jgi:hypothetical protein